MFLNDLLRGEIKMIYVSHSSLVNYKELLYAPLKSSHLNKTCNFVFPHEQDSANLFNTKALFKSGKCKLVLAEVSTPSTGQGIELGWANDLNIPIVCIYQKGCKVTDALKTVSSEFIEYEGFEDMIGKITAYLNNGASQAIKNTNLLNVLGELNDHK